MYKMFFKCNLNFTANVLPILHEIRWGRYSDTLQPLIGRVLVGIGGNRLGGANHIFQNYSYNKLLKQVTPKGFEPPTIRTGI